MSIRRCLCRKLSESRSRRRHGSGSRHRHGSGSRRRHGRDFLSDHFSIVVQKSEGGDRSRKIDVNSLVSSVAVQSTSYSKTRCFTNRTFVWFLSNSSSFSAGGVNPGQLKLDFLFKHFTCSFFGYGLNTVLKFINHALNNWVRKRAAMFITINFVVLNGNVGI